MWNASWWGFLFPLRESCGRLCKYCRRREYDCVGKWKEIKTVVVFPVDCWSFCSQILDTPTHGSPIPGRGLSRWGKPRMILEIIALYVQPTCRQIYDVSWWADTFKHDLHSRNNFKCYIIPCPRNNGKMRSKLRLLAILLSRYVK